MLKIGENMLSGVPFVFVFFFFNMLEIWLLANMKGVFPLTVSISKLSRSKVQHSACIIIKLCKAIVKKVYLTGFYGQT